VDKQKSDISNITFLPVTKDRWSDFETLFGVRGACGGCWCMLWRLKRSEFEQQKGEKNKQSMKAIIESGEVPGILAFSKEQPIAWCSVAPRERFPALERSRILKKIDAEPVWSISCLFVEKNHREKGLSVQIANAAVEYVKKEGGKIVEAYPVEPKKHRAPPVFVWTGLASGFKKAGFVECIRRSETRPIMRNYI
jgi:GNAT superfamily N-acetyltransferase